MPAGDSKLGQLASLRNRLIELDALLKEERKVTSRLRDQSEKKNEQIAIADAEITAEMERFRWKKEEILFTIRNHERDCRGRITTMKFEEKQLLEELAENDLVQFQNERFHARLKEISSEHLQTAQTFAQERETRKQKDFDTRMEMEEMLRKMIKNVDECYQTEAVSKMQREASQANVENDRIHTEFSIREAKTEALIRQQQYSYEQLMRTKIERDVMKASTEMQEANLTKMTHQNRVTDMQVRDLGNQVQRLRDEVTSLSAALCNKQDIDDRCEATVKMIQEQETDAQAWRAATLRLCKKLLKECNAIAEKGRVRGNAKVTQRLDSLISSSTHETDHAASLLDEEGDEDGEGAVGEGLTSLLGIDGGVDYEAMWKVPTGPMDEYRLTVAGLEALSSSGPAQLSKRPQLPGSLSTSKLVRTPTDLRRARAAAVTTSAVEGLTKKHSAPALLASSAKMYKSFSM